MPGYAVSVSVVTHNNEKYISMLLNSILERIKGIDYRIFVIDNKSKDKTVGTIKKINDRRITLIENDRNMGFGRAHNQILDVIDSKYHIIINPDVTISDDIVERLCKYLEENEDIGIVSPKVLFPDGRVQMLPKRNPRLIYLISRRIELGFLKRYRARYEMAEMDEDGAFDIEFATGCFMFIRTELLKKVKGFDERYFMYFEDADLTRKVRQYARAIYNPGFIIYHDWARGGAKSFKLLCIQIISMLSYMWKWKKYKGRK
jgi:GT2 family glycosyltransferase